MRLILPLGFAALVLCLAGGHLLAAEAAKDVLKERGLTKAGDLFVLPDETAVLDGMKALRVTKAEADKEVRARTAIDLQIAAKQKIMKDSDKEWHELETRLPLIQKPDIKNNIIIRMNRLVANFKQAQLALKDLEDQAGKQSISGKTKFVDGLMALHSKAAAASAKYATLANDAAVKAAVAKAGGKSALGPTPEFTAVTEELKKWQGGVESEAIALRRHGGIYTAEVLLNGERFTMCVDTGASFVALPGEVAEQLKMVPTEKDQVITLKLANGTTIQGHQMTLTTVRVGRFTVPDVRCVVLEKGLPDAPLLLGGSFLNHFIVKLDPAKAELQLTEVKQPGTAKPAAPASTTPK
jgi:aspartyl protease family protein